MAELLVLLDEVSADKPCGEYLEYDPAYLELGKNIQGKPEDPITEEPAQPPNWREIQKQSLAILQKSKDLQVIIYLLRALIDLEGIPGFRDGLKLLLEMLNKYWEQIHPLLDPDDDLDPTARVNILEELSNFDSVLKPLSFVALVESKSVGRFSLRDYHLATDKLVVAEGVKKPDINLIKGAFLDAAQENVAATCQAVNDCIGIVQQLDTLVGEKVGIENGPDLTGLTALLKEIRHVFDQFVADDLIDSDVEANEGDIPDDLDKPGATRKQASVSGGVNSRQDVVKALDMICKYYAESEPSSPVPILLQRAKKLVTADFMQIVQNLLPDGITQLQQIKGPDPDQDQ